MTYKLLNIYNSVDISYLDSISLSTEEKFKAEILFNALLQRNMNFKIADVSCDGVIHHLILISSIPQAIDINIPGLSKLICEESTIDPLVPWDEDKAFKPLDGQLRFLNEISKEANVESAPSILDIEEIIRDNGNLMVSWV